MENEKDKETEELKEEVAGAEVEETAEETGEEVDFTVEHDYVGEIIELIALLIEQLGYLLFEASPVQKAGK